MARRARVCRRRDGTALHRLELVALAGAAVVRATDAAGAVTGVQLVALQADGSAAKHWEHDGKLKLSFGTLGGAAVRLPGDDRALLLAEGPETALSCWYATGITTWCNLGSIARAPLDSVPLDRLIVVCADDDARNAQANKALRDAIRGWRRQGRRVVHGEAAPADEARQIGFQRHAAGRGARGGARPHHGRDRGPARPRGPAGRRRGQERAAEMIDAAIDDLLNPDPFARLASRDAGRGAVQGAAPADRHRQDRDRDPARRSEAAGRREDRLSRADASARRRAGRRGSRPRLGDKSVNVTVDIWRGRGQRAARTSPSTQCAPNPRRSPRRMPQRSIPPMSAKLCPAAADCPYLAQHERTAQIWVAAHDLLWHAMPPPLKGADLVVIDEGFATRGLTGLSGRADAGHRGRACRRARGRSASRSKRICAR